MVEFGMNVQQAIEAPKWLTRAFPASPFPHTMYPGDLSVESRIPEAVRKQLLARGHKLHVTGAWSDGSLAAIVVDLKTGVLNAGTDRELKHMPGRGSGEHAPRSQSYMCENLKPHCYPIILALLLLIGVFVGLSPAKRPVPKADH